MVKFEIERSDNGFFMVTDFRTIRTTVYKSLSKALKEIKDAMTDEAD